MRFVRRMEWRIVAAALLVLLLLTLVIILVARPGTYSALTVSMDFRAFYCASRALAFGLDPYRLHPALECQRAAAAAFSVPPTPDVVPAPLPPHALALLAPLAILPYRIASPIWDATLVLAFVATALLLARYANVKFALAFAALFLSDLYISFAVGQPGPILTFLVVCLGLSFRAGHRVLSLVCCLLLTAEPHIGLPILVAAFALIPSMRCGLLLGGACIVVLDLALGRGLLQEYVLQVIPLHALGEIDYARQFSLTSALWTLGVPIEVAKASGNASYVIMIALAVELSRAAMRKTHDRIYVAFVPALCSVVAGPYIHIYQIAIAVPLTLMIAADQGNAKKKIGAIAALVLAIPFQELIVEMVQFDRLAFLIAVPFAPTAHPIAALAMPRESNPVLEALRVATSYAGLHVPGPYAWVSLVPRAWTWFGLLMTLVAVSTMRQRERAPGPAVLT